MIAELHLGHVAKSFGLKETPSKVASKAKERANTHTKGGGGGDSKVTKQPLHSAASL